MALSADLLRGYTDTILLRQLIYGDSYGYRIAKQVSIASGGGVELKEATLYTAFRRLEQSGLIRSYWGDENSGARRRYYAITQAGRERLALDLAGWKETKQMLDCLLKLETPDSQSEKPDQPAQAARLQSRLLKEDMQ